MKKLAFIILSLALFTSCERKISEFAVDKGSANFTKYVAVGNSLVAGYADGALYHDGQVYSCPNIIAQQLQLAGGGAFIQPMVSSNFGVAIYPGVPPKFVLGYKTDCQGITSLSPVYAQGALEPLAPVGYSVNNLGIPGVRSFMMLYPGYAKLNPYYARFTTNMDGAVVQEFSKLSPTFFTMQLGDNDVLGWALSGGSPADSITKPQTFYFYMRTVLGAMLATGAQGVMANIPDITSIPFFTTVPYNGLVISRQTLADSINYAMSLYQLPFHYVVGQNAFIINDPTNPHPLHVRQMKPGELVLLSVPQDSMKCRGMGIINPATYRPYPIPDQFVLTLDEIDKIKFSTDAFNAIIDTLASNRKVGLVDVRAKMKELTSQSGVIWDGVHMTTKFVTGGAFSLDGVHLTPRGNALSANCFIDAINKRFGSSIPWVDATSYKGVVFP